MSTVVGFTLRDYFHAKGGYLRRTCENSLFRFELGISGVSCAFKSGFGLEAFRAAEDEFVKYLPDNFHLDRVSAADLGLDLGFLVENFVGATFVERYLQLNDVKQKQSAFLDGFGFVREQRGLIKRTLQEYLSVASKRCEALVCENEEQKNGFKELVSASADGTWDGLEYKLSHYDRASKRNVGPGENEIMRKLREVFSAWRFAKWIFLRNKGFESVERKWFNVGDDAIGDLEREDFRSIRNLRDRIGELCVDEKEFLYWGGRKPPASQEARESFVRTTFPQRGKVMSVTRFLQTMIFNMTARWRIDLYYHDLNDRPDLRELAIGQVIRAGDDIKYIKGGRSMMYQPRL